MSWFWRWSWGGCREVDYDVFYDDESGEVWFSDRMGEDELMDDVGMEW